MMDHHHHIMATDARDLLTHWTTAGASEGSGNLMQQQQQHQPEERKVALEGSGELKQKSRRSLTEAERGLNAEPKSLRPATTKAGKQRMRMKWSNDVNQFIMRSYYTITSNETVGSS